MIPYSNSHDITSFFRLLYSLCGHFLTPMNEGYMVHSLGNDIVKNVFKLTAALNRKGYQCDRMGRFYTSRISGVFRNYVYSRQN